MNRRADLSRFMPNKDNFLALNQSMDDRIALGENELSFQDISSNSGAHGNGVHSSYYKLPF